MPGPSVPSVNPARLKKLWNFTRDHRGFDPERALGRRFVELECGPVDDWAGYRAGMLYMLIVHPGDLLALWRRGFRLDDVVFRVAAVFPKGWIILDKRFSGDNSRGDQLHLSQVTASSRVRDIRVVNGGLFFFGPCF